MFFKTGGMYMRVHISALNRSRHFQGENSAQERETPPCPVSVPNFALLSLMSLSRSFSGWRALLPLMATHAVCHQGSLYALSTAILQQWMHHLLSYHPGPYSPIQIRIDLHIWQSDHVYNFSCNSTILLTFKII